jgi:hypothetical protein
VDLNLELIHYLGATLGVEVKFVLQSSLGVEGSGSELLVKACEKIGADTYLAASASKKFTDAERFLCAGITLQFYRFVPPVYPQLWGHFVENLSYLDLLLNCGEKSREIILKHNAGPDDPLQG